MMSPAPGAAAEFVRRSIVVEGAMVERGDGGIFRYGCQVGHAFSADSLVAE